MTDLDKAIFCGMKARWDLGQNIDVGDKVFQHWRKVIETPLWKALNEKQERSNEKTDRYSNAYGMHPQHVYGIKASSI